MKRRGSNLKITEKLLIRTKMLNQTDPAEELLLQEELVVVPEELLQPEELVVVVVEDLLQTD
jgi:hypothetical protein